MAWLSIPRHGVAPQGMVLHGTAPLEIACLSRYKGSQCTCGTKWPGMLCLGLAQHSRVLWLDAGHSLLKLGMDQLDRGQNSAWHSMAQLSPRPDMSAGLGSKAQLDVVQHDWECLDLA